MKKNEQRRCDVLQYLVDEYIKNREAVSSKLICEKYLPDNSSATIRIDLNLLEKENLIYQPHTSAGRVPTIRGYREYLEMVCPQLNKTEYQNVTLLRNLLVQYYRDTPMALHYIMQLLAKETDQLSFVAEPQVSYGYLEHLDVFHISRNKLLFVVSLDSGLDKTVILKTENEISPRQLRIIVKHINEELVGLRIYDIQNKYLQEIQDKFGKESILFKNFLRGLHNALIEMSGYFIHFDGSVKFLEQPEFDDRHAILNFLSFIQRQDSLINLMQRHELKGECTILMGEDLIRPELAEYALVYARYDIYGVPGYLGILGPVRMDYRKNITLVRDFARTITETTKKGMMVTRNG
ncbi:MAG: heat-inducible transcriptional repressor HrcA [Candidatus Cloacimonetes bacterium]|nr:heat-inducible transcriptional repressor HrcA [Candidatus Cloacimonadota bacterium]